MINVERPCWISKLEPFNGMWHLSENGKPHGKFDAIVIAHNGNIVPRYCFSSVIFCCCGIFTSYRNLKCCLPFFFLFLKARCIIHCIGAFLHVRVRI